MTKISRRTPRAAGGPTQTFILLSIALVFVAGVIANYWLFSAH